VDGEGFAERNGMILKTRETIEVFVRNWSHGCRLFSRV
jgi:hypothetical protein